MITRIASRALADALDAVVRGVPGVRSLYRSSSPVREIVAVALPALRDDPLVLVDQNDDGLSVTVTIAVETSAAVTCRAVHDAIVDHLRGLGHQDGVVKVTVGQVLE